MSAAKQKDSALALLRQAGTMQPEMLRQLRTLVKMESPSHDKAAVDACGDLVARWLRTIGGRVKMHRTTHWGDSLEARFPGRRGAGTVMLLGHLDTVWAKGSLAKMPWRVLQDRICGPGVYDMKAGVVMMLTAISILQNNDIQHRNVLVLLHGDEEVGSPGSRRLTERLAKQCDAVYVLEPAQGPRGKYKTARKGVGQYRMDVKGVAAHSGVDFAAGHSAVTELAHQVLALKKICQAGKGITVNPGVIGGGTQSNVIAAEAWMEIDVRIARARDAEAVDRALHKLRARDKACRVVVSGGMNRPPMERTAGTIALFRRAELLAHEMGMTLGEAATGGASDGNFTSALGIPTLDGMGARGGGAHAPHEHVLLRDLALRTALLAAMLI